MDELLRLKAKALLGSYMIAGAKQMGKDLDPTSDTWEQDLKVLDFAIEEIEKFLADVKAAV